MPQLFGFYSLIPAKFIAAGISVFMLLIPPSKPAIGRLTLMRMGQISAHMHLSRSSDSLFLKVVKRIDELHSKLGFEAKIDSSLFSGSDFFFFF